MIEPAGDLNRASHHVRITCPHCQRGNLRIKRANLGCDVFCKHCGNRFRAVLANDPVAIATFTQIERGEPRSSVPAEADQRRGANGEGELQRIRAERDRLKADLRESEADRLRFSERAVELAALRTDRDRLEAAVWEGVAREKQLQARITAVEWRSGEAQDQAEEKLRVLEERLDAARLQLERDLTPLREEADRLRRQAEVFVRDRDDALRQIEALGSDRDRLAVLLEQAETAGREAARHEAEAHRLAQTIEQDRDQLAALVRRNEELAEQSRDLGTELDRLHRDQEDERRKQGMSLEALRHELENARAEATVESDRALAATATRAELEGRLAEFEDRLRAANEHSERLETELQVQRGKIEQDRDQLAALVRRNEELAGQARELGTELDRLHRDQEDERRKPGMSLEALRHELEDARAEATAASESAAAAAAARAELEGRLAEFEDRLRAAHEQSQQVETEMQALRETVAALPSESDPGRSLSDGDHEANQLRIEELTADLDRARAANERLCSLLNVFGLVDHLGPGAGRPPSG